MFLLLNLAKISQPGRSPLPHAQAVAAADGEADESPGNAEDLDAHEAGMRDKEVAQPGLGRQPRRLEDSEPERL